MNERKIAYILLPAFLGIFLLGGAFTVAPKQADPGPDPITRKVDSVLALMTLEEKIGQMTLYTTDWGSTGPVIRPGYADDIRSGHCGALFNSHTAAFTRGLQRIAVEESRLKIPLLFGFDVVHGYKTMFPIPLGEAASWDMEACEKSAEVAAAEAASAGLNWTFAPMVDLTRDPRWGRVMEGAGEDPYLGSRIARAKVIGFQGTSFDKGDRVLACVKHFAGYGAPIGGRDYNTVDMSEREFREVYLPPYKAGVEAGAWTVMAAFNDLDGVPSTGNSWLMKDILRGEWNFPGFVVTDYTGINEMVSHGIVANQKEAGELAVLAGVDMDMQSAAYQDHLKQSVEEGKVPEARIDEAVRAILRTKFLLGLFDDPYKFCNEEREQQVLLSAENQAVARDVARKSIVLLRNEGVLPLAKEIKTLAVIGPLADDQNNLIGAWSGAGEGRHCVSLLSGIRNKLGKGVNIIYAKGCEIEGEDQSGFAAALAAAQKADAVVLAIGEHKDMSGEATSRATIRIPGQQEELARQLMATGKPVAVVLMNGRPLVMPWLAENAPALLECWWLGTQAGNAIADVLFGDYNPSGKLPISFPRLEGQIPIFYSHKNTGRPFDLNSKWTSKYVDIPNSPQFPFGYGLSYTSFRYGKPQVDKTVFRRGQDVTLTVTVENTGRRAGEEVVQFYLRDLVGSVTRPVQELKGFQKIMLKPGERREIQFTLTENDLAFYTRTMQWAAETGSFDLMVGGSSDDVQSVRVTMIE
ncbi:MAG: glycoside hydrolase family 3 C-terminal domain-containing protein [Phaeodactylibacter sp.]|nr:glycoside hydrolase family 3 C-terminal domain-containing protein [Phaeodactylibacter sp.]